MRYRTLGATGIRVSEIGFGAWGIGGRTHGATSYGWTDVARSAGAIRRALDEGVTFFDTSPAYGDSEALIGEVLGATARDRYVLATKVGYSNWTQPPDFSVAGVRRSVAESLRRLRTDYLDVIQLHNPPVSLFGSDELVLALDQLVDAGTARCWGVSVKSPSDALAIMAQARPSTTQVNLNMMDVRAFDSRLLDLAASKGVGVIARTPLCFGFLSGELGADTKFAEGDHRGSWNREQLARWASGAQIVQGAVRKSPGATWNQNALRFCLSFSAVSTVIPGMLSADEVSENAAASGMGALHKADVDAILDINRRVQFL